MPNLSHFYANFMPTLCHFYAIFMPFLCHQKSSCMWISCLFVDCQLVFSFTIKFDSCRSYTCTCGQHQKVHMSMTSLFKKTQSANNLLMFNTCIDDFIKVYAKFMPNLCHLKSSWNKHQSFVPICRLSICFQLFNKIWFMPFVYLRSTSKIHMSMTSLFKFDINIAS